MASPVKERLKTVRVPLVGSYNQRGIDGYASLATSGQDQRFINCIIVPVQNPLTGKGTAYVEKRTGLETKVTVNSVAATPYGKAIYASPGSGNGTMYASFGLNNATFHRSNNSGSSQVLLGTTTTAVTYISEIAGEAAGQTSGSVLLISTSNSANSYFWPTSGSVTTDSRTGDTTNGSPIVTNLSTSTSLREGQRITGTGIPTNTYIESIDSGTQITLTQNATATNVGVTLDNEFISKFEALSTFPTTGRVGAMVELDGYVFSMDTYGKIYNSNLNDILTWNSTDFIQTEGVADTAIGLARYKNYVAALSTGSIEFFYDAGNDLGSPLRRETNAMVRQGVGTYNTSTAYTWYKDRIFWYGGYASNEMGVWMLEEDFKPRRISNPTIEKILYKAFNSSAKLSAFEYMGKTFLCISRTDGVVAYPNFWYCIDTGEWTEMDFGGNFIFCGNHQSLLGVDSMDTNGFIYDISNNISTGDSITYQDRGSTMTMTIQTSKLDFDTEKRKRFHKIALIGDEQSSAASVSISWSDDDYQTWSTARTVDMSNSRAYLTNCGAARRRAFKITNSSNTPLRLEALEITYSELDK